MKTDTEPLLDTEDMGLAIALICREYELASLEHPIRGNRITFRFKAKDGIHMTAQDYWNGKLLVNAKTFWNESKNLKTRLYSIQ